MDCSHRKLFLVQTVTLRIVLPFVFSFFCLQNLFAQQTTFSDFGDLPPSADTPWATLQTGGGLDFRSETASTFSLFGGWNYSDERDRFGVGYYPAIRFDEDATAGMSIGKRFGSRLRTELEFTWRRNVANPAYDYWVAFGLPYYSYGGFEGYLNTYSGMANAIFEFDRAEGRLLTPYVGAGIGMAYIDTDVSFQGRGETVSNETAFAYQAIGGASLKLTQKSDLFFEYRYFATESKEFHQPGFDTGFSIRPSRDFFHSFQHHSFIMGIRFHF